ncbi:nucleoporin-interacting protein NIC96 [Auriculariales sp. MPI-PUGE-AT-0066]|nr:nucleoporin-interacting protein NIC96 [Auriculariales sp. MPI-PUGE-AT-0066]
MSNNDLNALLTSSRALNSQLSRPDLPTVHLSLDQIEAQSRRLTQRQGVAEPAKANYLLAQAHVDASTLGSNIAALNTATVFTPLQPLADTDVTGFLKHAHEQTILSSIEESRRDTQAEFYRVLEERIRRDWDSRKRRIMDEFGVRGYNTSDQPSLNSSLALRNSASPGMLRASIRSAVSFAPNLQMRAKMNVYTRVVVDLNSARLAEISYPIIQSLHEAALQISERSTMADLLDVLQHVTDEPHAPGPQGASRAGVHTLNMPKFERKFAQAYLSSAMAGGKPSNSRDAVKVRVDMARGARESLERQYWDLLVQTVHAHPQQAALGGDPSPTNYVRAFIAVKLYRSGKWDERLELLGGVPLWAKLFYLIRTGKIEEALQQAEEHAAALNARERAFTTFLKAWAEAPDRKLPRGLRDRLLSAYNSHLLHSPTTDPYKLAIYKLIGRLDPGKRTVQAVTGGIEDWMWFQLAMVDEDDGLGLKDLQDVVLGYGERYFEPPKTGVRGTWVKVLTLCGAYEQAVAALNDKPDTQVEAMHLAIALTYHGLLRVPERAEASDGDILVLTPASPASLNLALLVSRYIRPILQGSPKEALEYVACLALTSDQGPTISKEQKELAWEQTRRIVSSLDDESKWETLVGAFRPDGTRLSGAIEHYAKLLGLADAKAVNDSILTPAAAEAENSGKLEHAIRLYNLAGAYDVVVRSLARVLAETVGDPVAGGVPDEQEAVRLEATAREIMRHYERLNRAAGKERVVISKLFLARDGQKHLQARRYDRALEAFEQMEILPMLGDQAAIRRAGEQLMYQDDGISRNLGTFLKMMMECLKCQREALRHAVSVDPQQLTQLRKKSSAIQSFAGALKGKRLNPEVYEQLSRAAVDIAL